MSRVLKVVRLQFLNKQTFIIVPLIILGSVLAFSMVLFAMLPKGEVIYSGAGQAVMWYFFAIGLTSLTLTFPFSQALSITRREFFFGTMLSAGLASLIVAALSVIFGWIESATGGWGMNGWLFAPPWLWESGPLTTALFSFTLPMLLFMIGFLSATVYRTWGPLVITLSSVVIGVLLVGSLLLISKLDLWGDVGQFLAQLGVTGIVLCALALTAILAGASFLAIRRATP